MYAYCEYDEIADQIASDIPARETISMEEALRITRHWLAEPGHGDDAPPVIVGVALALWRSYQSGPQ